MSVNKKEIDCNIIIRVVNFLSLFNSDAEISAWNQFNDINMNTNPWCLLIVS